MKSTASSRKTTWLKCWGFFLSLPMLCAINGCGSPAAGSADDHVQLRVLGRLYGSYLSQHRGSPPRDEEQFKRFLESSSSEWRGLGVSSVEELLISPGDKQRLTLLFGSDVQYLPDGSLPWIAYESQGRNEKRLIVNARGTVQEVTVEELNQLIPSSQ